jgi:hypothetical protein
MILAICVIAITAVTAVFVTTLLVVNVYRTFTHPARREEALIGFAGILTLIIIATVGYYAFGLLSPWLRGTLHVIHLLLRAIANWVRYWSQVRTPSGRF